MKKLFPTKFFKNIFRFLQKLTEKKPDERYVYVAIGDSTVEGIGASGQHRSYAGIIYEMIKSRKQNAKHYNLGKSGAPTQQVIDEQLDRAIELQPDLITISVGTNDMRTRVRPSKFEKNLETILKKIVNETDAKVVINNIPDFSFAPLVPLGLRGVSGFVIRQYNNVLARVAKKYNVAHIDLHTNSKVYGKIYPEIIGDDKFHPSDFGHALWANTIITSVEHILFPKKISDTH